MKNKVSPNLMALTTLLAMTNSNEIQRIENLYKQVKKQKNNNLLSNKNTVSSFEKLNTINKKDFIVSDTCKLLLPEHRKTIHDIYEIILNDDSVEEINVFESWTNQFLGQLLHAGINNLLDRADELRTTYDGKKKQRANVNNLISLQRVLRDFNYAQMLRLLNSQEAGNYPISLEGVTALKEYKKLNDRFNEIELNIINQLLKV